MSGIWIILMFIVVAIQMARKKLPTIIALPLLATGVAFVSGTGFVEYLNNIVLKGSTLLGGAMCVVIFGAMFANVIRKVGISDYIISHTAELSSDNPFLLALALWLATVFVFMGVGGLGGVIMVGSIIIPLLLSAGVEPVIAVSILLLGVNLGGALNTANYALNIGIFGGDIAMSYLVPCSAISAFVSLAFIIINVPGASIGTCLKAIYMLAVGIVNIPGMVLKSISSSKRQDNGLIIHKSKINAVCCLATILPLVVIFGFKYTYGFDVAKGGVNPTAATILGFFVAAIYAILTSRPKELLNILSGSLVEGVCDVAGVIFLFIGIGMLASSVMQPATKACLEPLLKAILPSSNIGLLVFFAFMAPAALYRGPLNMYGMGSGLATVLMAMGQIHPGVLCGIFQSSGYVQGICDPTNSHNTWLAGFADCDSNAIMKKLLPYAWSMTVLLLTYVAFVYGFEV